jgi:hypothetical protein
MHHCERKADGNSCIDGVAACPQHLYSRISRQVMHGHHHGMRSADGLVIPESLSGPVRMIGSGVLREDRRCQGQDKREQ